MQPLPENADETGGEEVPLLTVRASHVHRAQRSLSLYLRLLAPSVYGESHTFGAWELGRHD